MRTLEPASLPGTNEGSVRHGLTSAEAACRLARFGPNDLVPARGSGGLVMWLERLIADPMVVLLAVAGTTYGLLGDRFDAVVVCAALLPIFAVTAVLEYRSDRALQRLSRSAPPRARVLRDGGELQVPASEVVPGDILLLREGDVIAADGYLLQATRLLVDESALTGESLPVENCRTAGIERQYSPVRSCGPDEASRRSNEPGGQLSTGGSRLRWPGCAGRKPPSNVRFTASSFASRSA